MNIVLFVLLAALQMGCKKDVIITPEFPEPTEPIEEVEAIQVVWQKPLIEDSSILSTTGGVVYQDKLIVANPRNEGEILQFLDKRNGDFLFEWAGKEKGGTFSTSDAPKLVDNKIFVNTWTKGYLIDANTGQTNWSSKEVEHGEPRASTTLGGIYHGILNDNLLNNEFSYLTKLNLSDGTRDTIFTIQRINGYEPSIEPPAGWINSNGDTILIWLSRLLDFGGTLDEQLDAYAYNLTADSLEWKLTDFDLEGSSRIGAPLIEDDLVYFAGQRTFYCLNAKDGTTVWKRRFEDDTGALTETLFTSAFIKVDNKLVISPSNRNTYCFNAFTGDKIWKEIDSASSPKNMLHHNGVIYCASRGRGKLFAFDVETGEHYWRENSPNKKSDDRALFTTNIAIDYELGYLYTTDRFFIMCIKLIGS